MKAQEQLEKLARTLLNSGLALNSAEAMKKAKEILKVAPKEEKVDIEKLPKIGDLKAVSKISLGISDLDKDKSLKEVVEEDAEKIYNNKKTPNKQ